MHAIAPISKLVVRTPIYLAHIALDGHVGPDGWSAVFGVRLSVFDAPSDSQCCVTLSNFPNLLEHC